MSPLLSTLSNFYSTGRFASRIRKEVLFIDMCGMSFPNHHHFTGIFDRKSKQLFVSGQIQYKSVLTLNSYRNFTYSTVQGPRVLDLRKLEPGFVICMTCATLALIAFLFEWMRTLRDYLFIRSLFSAFYRMRVESLLGNEIEMCGATILRTCRPLILFESQL